MTWSEFDSGGLRWSVLFFLQVQLAYLLLRSNWWRNFDRLSALFVNAAVMLSIVAVLRVFMDLSFTGLALERSELSRLNGWMRSANHFSIYVGLAFILLWNNFIKKNSINVIQLSKLLLFSLVIVLSGSRGTMLTLAVVLVLTTVASLRSIDSVKVMKKYLYVIFFVAVASFFSSNVLSYFGYSGNEYQERIIRSEDNVSEDPRMAIWVQTLTNWDNGDLMSKIGGFGREESNKLAGRSTHNSYLTALVDYGLLYVFMLIFVSIYAMSRSFYLSFFRPEYLAPFGIVTFLFFRSFTNTVFGGVGIHQIIFNLCLLIILFTHEKQKNTIPAQ
jgi:hypothetical protein